MNEEKILLSPKSVARRWDYSPNAIANFEKDGILTRVPQLPSPRYSIEQIRRIENFGEIVNPFELLEQRIKKLESENQILRSRLSSIKLAGGF